MGRAAELTAPRPAPGNTTSLAAQYAKVTALKAAEEERQIQATTRQGTAAAQDGNTAASDQPKEQRFRQEWWWMTGVVVLFLLNHVSSIYYFTSGFLLTRLVLDDKSACTEPPAPFLGTPYNGIHSYEGGCWHPKTFDKAVIIIIDALRYDFTVPHADQSAQAFHNAFPFLYDTAVQEPQRAFLRPFIADPPTTTLQRLKGLTTGTLPTFIDAGSNFAGTAIEEDNLLMQLRDAGRRLVHLGDDTWTALFPSYFEPNISRAYDSLNVWDLHTVDNGVIEHIFPLLSAQNSSAWDVMFAHFLGVDHAGHRYGPNHPAMTAKLQQMDEVLRRVVAALDQDTLLVVMGDHGMDSKGDHGGESDDEVEAALWMYSKKGVFARTDPTHATPPPNAKVRPVNQIDIVPTLALLLGVPIPFNNLGAPIADAFAGGVKDMWQNLAMVSRMTAAGIQRYQASYRVKRGDDEVEADTARVLWDTAQPATQSQSGKTATSRSTYDGFSHYQAETLRIFRAQWSRFNVPAMIFGIMNLSIGLLALLHYGGRDELPTKGLSQIEAGKQPQLQLGHERTSQRPHVLRVAGGTTLGLCIGFLTGLLRQEGGIATAKQYALAAATLCGSLALLSVQIIGQQPRWMGLGRLIPRSFWSYLAIFFTLTQSIGYASNSYTIWEDSILLYFLSTFGVVTIVASWRIESRSDRALAIYHSITFVALTWLASFSKLCREEQMPYCKSTYYSSATSSTSAPWQLLIPLVLALLLPSIIKSFYQGSRSYEAFAPTWIGCGLRGGLALNAIFWILDAADDGEWFSSLRSGSLKAVRVPIALTILGVSLVAGPMAYRLAPACVSITTSHKQQADSSSNGTRPTIVVLGYANTHGALYLLLPLAMSLSLILVQKPVGQGAMGLFLWQALALFEILDLNGLTTSRSPIGPITLALLASFHFFKTGHQHVLSTIQWETAFIPFYNLVYPWSPLLIVWNTFGAAILGTALLPLVVLWKRQARGDATDILRDVSMQLARYLAYWTTIALATMCWAGWLRRHLMLYRIFSPRFMGAVTGLLLVDLVAVTVVMTGVGISTSSVRRIFGWS